MTPHADLVAHVGCGDVDNMGRCEKCQAIRRTLAALPPPADPHSELEEFRLKLRIYENGDHINQPLVDDIERWRRELSADPPALVALGERLRTQDNQMTAHPIFVVEHRADARRPWEFVTACLTDEGARAYMNANGHNLRKFSRIFVHSGYRNDQWIGLRNHLMALAAPPVTDTGKEPR